MGYYPLDVILVQTIALGYEGAVITHVCHCIAEHGTTLLIEVVQTMIDGEVTWRTNRTACLQVQEGQALAVSTEIRVHHTNVLFLRSFHQHGSGTVTEKRTGSTVLIVNHRRHFVGANHDDFLVAAALNHRCCHIKRVEESTASSPEVERKSILQSKFAQHDASRRRKFIISRRSGDNDGINGIRIYPGFLYQLLGSLAGHVAGAETFLCQDAAFLDTNTRHNPLIIGIYHTSQFCIIQNIIRYVATNTGDYSIDLFQFSIINFQLSITLLPRPLR